MQIDLDKKVIILTGATGGIGSEILKELLKRNCTVYCMVRDKSKLKGVNMSHIFEGDITDPLYRKISITKILEKEGYISSLINCIGTTKGNWKTMIDINLSSIYDLTNLIIPNMITNREGEIINITSIASEQAFKNNPAYMASKSGLKMLTKAIAMDYGMHNIRANNICLGYIYTKMTEKSHCDSRRYALIKNRTMLERWGTPKDVVGPVLFLLSDMSRYVTGTDLVVDGGWIAKGI
jgi:gluconate 5-dehydrogenase